MTLLPLPDSKGNDMSPSTDFKLFAPFVSFFNALAITLFAESLLNVLALEMNMW
jgi:hypothetical protein